MKSFYLPLIGQNCHGAILIFLRSLAPNLDQFPKLRRLSKLQQLTLVVKRLRNSNRGQPKFDVLLHSCYLNHKHRAVYQFKMYIPKNVGIFSHPYFLCEIDVCLSQKGSFKMFISSFRRHTLLASPTRILEILG